MVEFSTLESMLSSQMWQSFAQQLDNLDEQVSCNADWLVRSLVYFAKSLASTIGSHPVTAAAELAAIRAFLELGTALQTGQGQRMSFLLSAQASLMAHVLLDLVNRLALNSYAAVIVLERLPPPQLLHTVIRLMDHCLASGSTAVVASLATQVQACCRLAAASAAVGSVFAWRACTLLRGRGLVGGRHGQVQKHGSSATPFAQISAVTTFAQISASSAL